MGNSAGKENDINNLMHVTIVKDADLPKAEVAQNKASGEIVRNLCMCDLKTRRLNSQPQLTLYSAIRLLL